ncbi:MAG: aerotolerance regulator BatA [Elusimicrobia bacterium CG08_land_8_20_14_0_20_44_26]|nr:MAG: aerotolerance regulator BatA [Elusimicrobia bacterium CG08_land_8_20_14_0_20_44_26]
MKFLLPGFFVFLPVILLAFYVVVKKKEVTAVYFSRADSLKKLGVSDSRLNVAPFISATVMTLVFFALLRPAKGIVKKEEVQNARDIFVVMDTSISMNAVDISPDRITAAKQNAKDFIKKRVHDKMGLVVFGGAAYIHCPLTFDHTSVLNLIDEIETGMTASNGTAIGDGIAVAVKHLSKSAAKSKIIILLTDGADNSSVLSPEMSSELAKNLDIKIYSVGIGVPGEAKIPVNDPVFGKRLVKIADELNEPLLTKISAMTSGKYFRATSLKELAGIYDIIDKLEETKALSSTYLEYREFEKTLMHLAFLIFCAGNIFRFSLLRRIP